MSAQQVLVTGASGFIAKHCIAELFKQGFKVRGTVRSKDRLDEIKRAAARLGVDDLEIELVEADLTRDAGWDEAASGCDYVLHVASPFPVKTPRDKNDLIVPARDGAIRVIKAAAKAGVKRLVLTSSIIAIMQCGKPDSVPRTEEDWSPTEAEDFSYYGLSKTIAEREAWSMIEQLRKETEQGTAPLEMAVVNPGFVLGPALDKDVSTSHEVIRMLGKGVYPMLPKLSFPVVDARDVAAMHVLAMKHPAAAGKRWICCDTTLNLKQIGQYLVEGVPDLKRSVPTIEAPSLLLRLGAYVDANLKSIRHDLEKSNLVSNAKARSELDFKFRSAREATLEAAKSLRELRIF